MNNRLTEKVKNIDDYIKLPTKDKQEFINKLGKLEDLLQSYNIKDLEELDKLLEMATTYEELSKQLGCPLDVLLKIIENKLFSIIYFVDEIRPEIHKTDYSDYKYWYTRKRYGKPDEMYTEDEFNKIMNWLYKKRGKNNES